jgi:2Fe-2S ferredoxin
MQVFNIHFQFEESHKQPLTVQAVEGETLLEVAHQNDIELHHNCGGVCACTTCHVYIDEGGDRLSEMEDKEEDYVDRAFQPRIESRLACQCRIFGDITLTIPDQSRVIGHEH